jgi:hypothetical protein
MDVYHDMALRSARNRLLGFLFSSQVNKFSAQLPSAEPDSYLRIKYAGLANAPRVTLEEGREFSLDLNETEDRLTVRFPRSGFIESLDTETAAFRVTQIEKGPFSLQLIGSKVSLPATLSLPLDLTLEQLNRLSIPPPDPAYPYPLRDLPVCYAPDVNVGDPGIIFLLGVEKAENTDYTLEKEGAAGATTTESIVHLNLQKEADFQLFIEELQKNKGLKVFTDGLSDSYLGQFEKALADSLLLDRFVKTLGDPILSLDELRSAIADNPDLKELDQVLKDKEDPSLADIRTALANNLSLDAFKAALPDTNPGSLNDYAADPFKETVSIAFTDQTRLALREKWNSILQFKIDKINQDVTYSILAERKTDDPRRSVKGRLINKISYLTRIKTDLAIAFADLDENPLMDGEQIRSKITVSSGENVKVIILGAQLNIDYHLFFSGSIAPGDEQSTPMSEVEAGKFSLRLNTDHPESYIDVSYEQDSGAPGVPVVTVKKGDDLKIESQNDSLVITVEKDLTPIDELKAAWKNLSKADRNGFALDFALPNLSIEKTRKGPDVLITLVKSSELKDGFLGVKAFRINESGELTVQEILKNKLEVSVPIHLDVTFAFEPPAADGFDFASNPAIKFTNAQLGVDYQLYAFAIPPGLSLEEDLAVFYNPDVSPFTSTDLNDLLSEGKLRLLQDGDLQNGFLSNAVDSLKKNSILVVKASKPVQEGPDVEEAWLNQHLLALVRPDPAKNIAGNQTEGTLVIRITDAQAGVAYQIREEESKIERGSALITGASRLGWESRGRAFGMQVGLRDTGNIPGDYFQIQGGGENLKEEDLLEFIVPLPQTETTYEMLAIHEYTGLTQLLDKKIMVSEGVVTITP